MQPTNRNPAKSALRDFLPIKSIHMMQESRFWAIIEDSRAKAKKLPPTPSRDFIERHERTLCDALRALTPKQIIAFEERALKLSGMAYRWDLWAAAYWCYGGCGNDAFMDFRWNMICLGRKWYYRLLNNPDDLADLIEMPDAPCMPGEWSSPYLTVYKEKTGKYPEIEYPDYPKKPAGEDFDFEDRELMRKRYPKLAAKFPDMGD